MTEAIPKMSLDHLRTLPDGSLTQAEVNLLITYIEQLEKRADEAALRSIEARNPGIDMEAVKAAYFGGPT